MNTKHKFKAVFITEDGTIFLSVRQFYTNNSRRLWFRPQDLVRPLTSRSQNRER